MAKQSNFLARLPTDSEEPAMSLSPAIRRLVGSSADATNLEDHRPQRLRKYAGAILNRETFVERNLRPYCPPSIGRLRSSLALVAWER